MIFNLFKKRAILKKYPDPMTAEEAMKVLAEQGQGSRIWQALDLIIDNELLDAVNAVADPKLQPHAMSHASGRIDAISTLKAKIEEGKSWRSGKMNYLNSLVKS